MKRLSVSSPAVVAGLLCALTAGPLRSAELGVAARIYPAGAIATVEVAAELSPRDTLSTRVGYNWTDRRDWGEHDNEQGGGGGVGLAWRHALRAPQNGWFVGAGVDVWWLDIDWLDQGRAGSTSLKVLQPTARIGYGWSLADEAFTVDLAASLGAELNFDTAGEDVGEGAIVLVGLTLRHSF